MKTLTSSPAFGMQATFAAAITFWEAVNTPRSLGLALRAQYGMLSELVRVSVKPSEYLDATSFAVDYAAVKYLGKLRCDVGIDREASALRAFADAESRCCSTNIRLTHARPLTRLETILHSAREKIERVLGHCDVDTAVSLSRFGPGATATVKGAEVRPEMKYCERRISVTPDMLSFAQRVVGRDVHWCLARGIPSGGPCTLLESEFVVTPFMRVVTVPKDAKIDRTIGAEPTFNTWIQAGIGRLIRRRLRAAGVNLDDQSINQTWAELALTLDLATIDISQASDSVSYWLVEELLPRKWFRLLDAARSGYAKLPGGKLIPLEKFSSMGNGYTFELETLIFWALAQAVCEEGGHSTSCVSVYGDDIIIPSPACDRFYEVLQGLGFVVNTDKSYSDGYFYESCGKHYFSGVDVTPVYQKELCDDLPQLVRAHNRIFRWWDRVGRLRHIDLRRCLSLFERFTCSLVKDGQPPRIPQGFEGDAGLLTRGLEVRFSDRGFLLKVIQPLPKRLPSISDAALLALTLGTERSNSTGRLDYLAPVDTFFDSGPLGGPHECMVPVRGDDGYKITSRWISERGSFCVWSYVDQRRAFAHIE